MPSIGFDSRERPDPRAHLLVGRLGLVGQELVQRRIEQPDRHRQARHRLEDPLEVLLLERQQPLECGAAPTLAVGEDHLLHDRQAVAEEHVLGAAETDPLRAELACTCRVLGVVGVGTHLEPPLGVGPAEDRLEVLVDLRRHERHLADERRGRYRRRS